MADKEGITIYMQGLFAETQSSAMQQKQLPNQVSQQEQISAAQLAHDRVEQHQTHGISSADACQPEEMTREMRMAAACRQIAMVGFEPISGVFDAGVKW